MTHIATRSFELTDGKHCFAYGEVRYTFTVTKGRKAATWANASGGFSPAEGPRVEITQIEWRWHNSESWVVADGALEDLLAEVTDDWFLEQLAEAAA